MVLGSCLGGCISFVDIPNQSEFAPLDMLAEADQAVVRLYIAPTWFLGGLATHPWFLVKAGDARTFDRWEVTHLAAAPHGYVHKDLHEPEETIGTDSSYVFAELVGEEAAAVVQFITSESPLYPCRNRYLFYPGPNSNTYARWVLDQTGWDVKLPLTAIGQELVDLCR
jgi:hypothetical protein